MNKISAQNSLQNSDLKLKLRNIKKLPFIPSPKKLLGTIVNKLKMPLKKSFPPRKMIFQTYWKIKVSDNNFEKRRKGWERSETIKNWQKKQILNYQFKELTIFCQYHKISSAHLLRKSKLKRWNLLKVLWEQTKKNKWVDYWLVLISNLQIKITLEPRFIYRTFWKDLKKMSLLNPKWPIFTVFKESSKCIKMKVIHWRTLINIFKKSVHLTTLHLRQLHNQILL